MFFRYFFFIFFLDTVAYAQSSRVEVTIETDVYNYAQELLAGTTPLEINNFSGKHVQRDVVEFILVQKALALGGAKLEFSFTTGNYDARNSKLLQDGLLLINFDTMWLSHAKTLSNDVYISDAVIRKGEYLAGIYTSLANKDKILIDSLSDFQKLSVISNKNWPVDWYTIEQLQPKSLAHEEEWLSMAKLVSMGWVDVMLAPFTREEPYNYQSNDYHITAIEGVKIALNDSRHFVVSKNHPQGKMVFQALQKGLKTLRAQGVIEKAYRQSGFITEKVTHWQTINETLLHN